MNHVVRIKPRLLLAFRVYVDEFARNLSEPAATRHGELLRHAAKLLSLSASEIVLRSRLPSLRESQYVLLNATDLATVGRALYPDWSLDVLSFTEGWCPRDEPANRVLDALIKFTAAEIERTITQ